MNLQRIEAGREFVSDAAVGVLAVVVGYTLFADTVSVPVVGDMSANLVGGIALVVVAAVWFAKRRRDDGCGCC